MITNTQILNDGKVVTIEAEGGWSGPVRLPLTDAASLTERMKPTTDGSPFLGVLEQGLALPKSADDAIAQVTARDSVFERRELAEVYKKMSLGLVEHGTGIVAAQRILKDTDLKDSVKSARAAEKLTPTLAALPGVFEAALAPLVERAEHLSLAVESALLPSPVEGFGVLVREQRASEVRRACEALPENDRHAFALKLAGRGMIDAIHALTDSPTGAELVESDTLIRSREVVLRKIGGADLLTAWRDSLILLEKGAAVADVLAGQVLTHMPTQSKNAYAGQLQGVKRRIADMTKRARLNPWRADAA